MKKGYWLGKNHSEETKRKMSEAKLKKPTKYWLGKKRSEDTKEKIRKSKMGQRCNWKGGKTKTSNGYVLLYMPRHPNALRGKYIQEHRLVMEKHLGRYLKLGEEIHHINGNKLDNRIENLKLFKNRSEHRKQDWIDNTTGKYQKMQKKDRGLYVSV